MKREQLGGYLFEYIILELLKKLGYINVEQKKIEGRGTYHQIDATGIFNMPTPFIYPLRLICEAKYHKKNNVVLSEVRSFLGALKDISENYFAKSKNTNDERYNDVGCFFSVKSFSKEAQDYSWAQNIFLISLADCRYFDQFIKEIEDYLLFLRGHYNLSKEIHIKNFSNRNSFKALLRERAIIIATLNGIYPVMFVCKNSLLHSFRRAARENNPDLLMAEKTGRKEGKNGLYTIFNLFIFNEQAELSLPKHIAEKIIKSIEGTSRGKKIFDLDVPIFNTDREIKRRIFKIEVILR
jgi:hypothetical protein